MNPSQPAADILWLPSTESTNQALREASGGLDNLSVIAAEVQTAGRGQGGHSWTSEPGKNLTFSLLWRPSGLAAGDILVITSAVTLGIRDYLLSEGVESWIKWPNDIWVGERKICGILIENTLSGGTVTESIIGIGFNLNQDVWPGDLPNPVSLRQLSGKTYSPRRELRRLRNKICRRLAIADTPDGRSLLQEEFERMVVRQP